MFLPWFKLSTVLFVGVCLILSCSPSSSKLFGGSTKGRKPVQKVPRGFWDKERIASKITVRLVKKSWKPKGLTSDEYVDEFPGTLKQANAIMKATKGYEYNSRPLSSAVELFTDKTAGYDQSLDSIIIIHQLFSSADEFYFSKSTVTALGMRNVHRKFNLFVYDMPQLNRNFFVSIFREIIGMETHYEDMAEVMAYFFMDGIQQEHWVPQKLHILGYSYSGNLSGYIARHLQLVFPDHPKLASIVCLEPYSAGYNKYLVQINKDDAETVHIYHTSSQVEGTRERIATADFVFNSGFLQPDCYGAKAVFRKLFGRNLDIEPYSCSHYTVVPKFWYVILYSSKFKARQCDTWPRFRYCLCETHQDANYAYPIVNHSLRGIFFLKTTTTKPYHLGEEGSRCDPKEKERREKKRKEAMLRLNKTPKS